MRPKLPPQATLDVEGPLFVAERSEAPLRRAIVLNRKGTTNLGISLGEGTSVDLKDKLVIVHVAAEVRPARRKAPTLMRPHAQPRPPG